MHTLNFSISFFFFFLANLKYTKPDRLSYLKVLEFFAYVNKIDLTPPQNILDLVALSYGFEFLKKALANEWEKQKIFVSEVVMF